MSCIWFDVKLEVDIEIKWGKQASDFFVVFLSAWQDVGVKGDWLLKGIYRTKLTAAYFVLHMASHEMLHLKLGIARPGAYHIFLNTPTQCR